MSGIIELNRPESLNALNSELMGELSEVLSELQKTDETKVVILTGSGKSFAAGADIAEMSKLSMMDCYKKNYLREWDSTFRNFTKPIIAAVNGFALGGGCELAMLCDIIYASSNAKFSQPEIKLGTIPGGGGTQRLTRAIGKSKAMELILTGRHITAEEAERIGLVSKVFKPEELMPKTLDLAKEISSYSSPILSMCKEAVNKAFESNMKEGLDFERRLFHLSFATRDKKEGFSAFLEKRRPTFTNE